MAEQGWYKFENFVPPPLIARMIRELESAYVRCRNLQIEAGLPDTEGTTHHLIGQGESFVEYLALFEQLNDYTESYFDGKYILNAFGGNLLKAGMSYASNVHRDIRTYSDNVPLMLNTIVMLDDFTQENGSTWFMRRGHREESKPSDIEFNTNSFQMTGKSGDVVFFNSNMWHKAGKNKTNKPRRSLTPMFTKPFVKQQFNYAQCTTAHDLEYIKQVLGEYSRTPGTLREWYRKPDERFYRSDQG